MSRQILTLADLPPALLTQIEADALYATTANITSAITAHEALANPHSVYALDTDLSTHAGAADPHPVYQTSTEVAAAITAHEGLADPHSVYLTATEGNAAYSAAAHTHATLYVPLAGGNVLTGSLGPTTSATRDLGTTALRFAKLWATNAELTTALLVASKAVALDPLAGNTLAWNAAGFYSNSPTRAEYDALVVRVAALEAQMGAGVNGHYHLMGTWRQTAKATLPSTLLVREEAPAA